jgi:hypothetical protein
MLIIKNKEKALLFLQYNPNYYEYFDIELKNDKDITRKAVIGNNNNVLLMPKKFFKDKNFVLNLIQECNSLVFFFLNSIINKKIKIKFQQIEKILLSQLSNANPEFFKNLPDKLTKDKKFVLKLLDVNIDMVKYLNSKLLNDYDIQKFLVLKRPQYFYRFNAQIQQTLIKNKIVELQPEENIFFQDNPRLLKVFFEIYNKVIKDFIDNKLTIDDLNKIIKKIINSKKQNPDNVDGKAQKDQNTNDIYITLTSPVNLDVVKQQSFKLQEMSEITLQDLQEKIKELDEKQDK